MDFDCALWMPDVVATLQVRPFLLDSPEALIKSSVLNGKEYRTLMFDTSSEVQGSVIVDPKTGVPDFGDVVLEYTRTMTFAFGKMPGLRCDSEGHALSIGLGAGTLANFVRTKLPRFHVDVVEINTDIIHAARTYLGTPPEGTPNFRVHVGDGKDVFELVRPDVRYDLIIHDAYRPGPEIPPSLVAPEYVAQLASRLTDRGILVLNFCLPFYTSKAQIELLKPFRAAFKHMWMFEATAMSKVLVAHNYDIRSIDEEKSLFASQYSALVKSPCKWPSKVRSAGYQLYLEPANWEAQWLRSLHAEVRKPCCVPLDALVW